MTGLIELVFNGFPEGYCYPGDPNQFATDLVDNITLSFNTETGNFYYNFGPNEPSVDNRIYPWFKTGANFESGWYYWDADLSEWIMAHPVPASGSERRLWVGSTADLKTYDGGEDTAITATTGPFWVVDTNFDGRFPIGPGTVGSTVIAVTDTGGSHEATLTDDTLKHTHVFGSEVAGGNDDARFLRGTSTAIPSQSSMRIDGDSGNPQYADIVAGNLITAEANVASPDPIAIMPPYYGTYVIKRTSRIWRRGA